MQTELELELYQADQSLDFLLKQSEVMAGLENYDADNEFIAQAKADVCQRLGMEVKIEGEGFFRRVWEAIKAFFRRIGKLLVRILVPYKLVYKMTIKICEKLKEELKNDKLDRTYEIDIKDHPNAVAHLVSADGKLRAVDFAKTITEILDYMNGFYGFLKEHIEPKKLVGLEDSNLSYGADYTKRLYEYMTKNLTKMKIETEGSGVFSTNGAYSTPYGLDYITITKRTTATEKKFTYYEVNSARTPIANIKDVKGKIKVPSNADIMVALDAIIDVSNVAMDLLEYSLKTHSGTIDESMRLVERLEKANKDNANALALTQIMRSATNGSVKMNMMINKNVSSYLKATTAILS